MLINFAWILAGFHIAYTDIKSRIIENYIILIVLILSILTAYELKLQINYLASLITFLIGFLLFVFNVIGAGDVKLLSVLMLIIPSEYRYLFLLIMSIIGAFLGFLMIVFKSTNKGVAYGVAIVIAFFCIGILFFRI